MALLTLAVLLLAAACTPPPVGGGAPFQDIAVTTTPTAATITFTSSVAGDITLYVGTSLDPTINPVKTLTLAHSATNQYSATVGGLKPSTGYSFRLAATGVQPYTDITSLVTKPPVFRNIVPSLQYVNAAIDFDYDGTGPVTVTISKTLDFTTNYYRRKVLDAPSSGAHWQASFTDLDAGTAYAFQLTAPDAPPYTDITSLVTKHRNVTIKYTSLYVVDDGDGWPYGCGDLAYTHKEQGDFYSNYYMTMAVYQCVDSGTWVDLTQYGLNHRDLTDVHSGTFRTDFWVFDDDQKVLDPECTPDFISNTCGEVAWGYKYVDISQPGTHQFSVHTYGIQNSVDAVAYGEVTVSYS